MQIQTMRGFRLSPQQRHLWMLQQGDGGAPYRAQCSVLIEGEIEVGVLRTALASVGARHEILRTAFQFLPGTTLPVQVVMEEGAPTLDERDLIGLPADQQQTELKAGIRAAGSVPFDLRLGLNLRASLFTLSPHERVLFLNLPALCGDARSLENIMREIALSCVSPPEEPAAPPVQYADVAEILNELLESEETIMGREFWRSLSPSDIPRTGLGFENEVEGAPGFQPRAVNVTIAHNLLSRLEAQAARRGASLELLLLTCWQVLLWRLTSEAGVVVGAACDGRTYEGLDEAVGLFAKYLPILFKPDADLAFGDALAETARAVADAQERQEYFCWEDWGEHSLASSLPFVFDFDQHFSFQPAPGLLFTVRDQFNWFDRFKVRLSCSRRQDSLAAAFHYDAGFFREADIELLAQRFQRLLASAADSFDASVGELAILGDAERFRILFEFNETAAAEYAEGKVLAQLVEERVDRAPQRLALVYENREVTFGELDARANRLAHYLRGLGVGPESVVALCVERSLEMLIGVLGILKAGGAYLPLDAQYPKARLDFMLEDTRAKVLLTQEHLVSELPADKARIVCLDSDWEQISRESDTRPGGYPLPENLAYVIYTSGSTGKPKAVMVMHSSAVNLITALNTAIYDRHGGPLRVGVNAPLVFDASVKQILQLANGHTLVLVPEEVRPAGQELLAYVRAREVDVLDCTPSQLRLMLAAGLCESGYENPSVVLVGGEAIDEADWSALAPCGAKTFYNLYGPTECTVDSTTCRIEPSLKKPSIGRPIANTQVYIVDGRGRAVPIGVWGEVYVGGAGVARGYLGRPELTAERFVPDAFSGKAGGRLYRTGDFGRYGRMGEMEFLGRMDQQVKIRGHRIELGEVEEALRRHGQVRDCVVVARGGVGGAQQLAGYVVLGEGVGLGAGELRSWLREALPDYMVPSQFVVLGELPLTPNGKVDREALPEAGIALGGAEASGYAAPRTPTEQVLSRVWQEVLGVERAGVGDNFFELGGDSILAIQVIARAGREGLRLTLRMIFQHQTVGELAAAAEDMATTAPTQQGLVSGEAPLTPIQRRFFGIDLNSRDYYNQALMLGLRRRLEASVLQRAVHELLLHHDALRLRFRLEDGEWKQRIDANAGAEIFTSIDYSTLDGSTRTEAVESEAARSQASLNLESGPLMRVVLFELGSGGQRLFVVIHHLAVDGVSWRVILEDLEAAYLQLEAGGAVRLPSKTTSYKHWAERLAIQAQSERREQELGYWLVQTGELFDGGMRAGHDRSRIEAQWRLPVDYPGGQNTIASAGAVQMRLSAEESRALLQDVPATYRTQINDVLLTALAAAFARWTGWGSLLVDVEGHGREELFDDVDVSRTVGWFTSLYPVRLRLAEGDFGASIKSIKEHLRSIPERGIGYGLLRYLGREDVRDQLSRGERAEVSFNYLGQLDGTLNQSKLLEAAAEGTGPWLGEGARDHLLEINARLQGGQMRVTFSYSRELHKRETIEALAVGYLAALRDLIEHCRAAEAGGYTPSDFPLVDLDQGMLDKIVQKVKFEGAGD